MPPSIARHAIFLLALLPGPQAQAASRAALEALEDIRSRIQARDCAGAVGRLKDGLKAGHAEVSLMAGSMYENGICVKAGWANAVTFYVQAHQGGLAEAAERLAAGYADPANGPDAAAALWWSLQGRGGARTDACAISSQAAKDPDRFVAELQGWAPAKLATCTYIAGVISTVSAEVKYPRLAQAWSMGGDVTLRFLPAVPRIDLKKGETEAYRLFGWVDGDTLRDREARPVADSFEASLREVARRALRRYPQPAGIPADAEVAVRFVFGLEDPD